MTLDFDRYEDGYDIRENAFHLASLSTHPEAQGEEQPPNPIL